MFKTTILTLGLLVVFNANAGCLPDSVELGDIGPESQLVCEKLESMYPDKHIVITGRELMSHNDVTILLTVEAQEVSLNYRLVGADWKLSQPLIANYD